MKIDDRVKSTFPDLILLTTLFKNVTIKPKSDELEKFKTEFILNIRSHYDIETLKDIPELRLYRDFFWKIGIDPTKTRPASEALIRRVIQGKPLPQINTLVDAYNLASMESRVPLAAFDMKTLSGDMILRFAEKGEEFIGIGMKSPVALEGNELVIEAGDELVAMYPHRDADKSKITLSTEDVLIVVCGAPGILVDTLRKAQGVAEEDVGRFCGGTTWSQA
ncbi:MAG: phenylalanine--tRNA ligase beta subunit-related protein [Candidatus Methanofastidiosia archaeon]